MPQKESDERLRVLQTLLEQAHQTLDEIRASAQAPTCVVPALRRWPNLPTDWPRLPRRPATPAFLRADYLDLYRPGAAVEVYIGACPGLGRIATELRVPQFKIGSCAVGRVLERMRQLGRDRYAAAWSEEGQWKFDRDFNDWFASFIECGEAPSPGSPVALTDRSFLVTLPDTTSQPEFENLLQRELLAISAPRWFASTAGRNHCTLAQAPLTISQRSTAYQMGVGVRLSPAVEIYVHRRRSDPERLLRTLEGIILRETVGAAR